MGAAVGLSVPDIKQMSMWEFFAQADGYMKAHSAQDDSLTTSEQDDLWAMVQRKMVH